MKTAMQIAIVLALTGVSAASEVRATVTPVQKVLELMQGMLAKGKEEKHAEQVQYAAYKQFCDDTSAEKKAAIAKADEMIMKLKADIEKYTADAAQLAEEIAAHEEDIAIWQGDEKAATKVRAIEKKDYDTLHTDYSESVDALERAIAVLKGQGYDRSQAAASFGQLRTLKDRTSFPAEAKKAIEAFLEQGQPDEGIDVSAPEAEGYEFQSQGIIAMLEKLLDKFIAERTQLEKDEMSSKQAYEMLMQDLENGIAQSTIDKDEKTEARAGKLEAKATAEGDLADTTEQRDADQKYLDDLTATCDKKAADFEARQTLRAEEIEAVEKAMEIIASSTVSGAADTYLPTMLQKSGHGRRAASLAQLRSEGQSEGTSTLNRARAVVFLQAKAKELQSRLLKALATRLANNGEEGNSFDPFVKVRKMIKDLIVKLMDEANEEASHKGWCDTELATNEKTRRMKTEAVELLHANIDELTASIAKLTEELAELSQAVADLDAAMAEATKLRGEEKEKNAQTVVDSQEAQTAVAQAITVLKEFYAKAAEATAFLQKAKKQEPPPIFESPYKGMQSENGGVVGMLEVIQSDFARLEAETKAAEETAQKEYEAFMTDSKVDKEAKETDIEHKTAKKQDEESALAVAEQDLEATQKELDAALLYFDKLKPSCVDADVSYEDRVARRKEEIASLQEALKILEGKEIVP